MAGSADGYRLVCNIAKGGMGQVELVVRADADFARLYARKRLLQSLVDDEQSRAMFRDEARIAGMLRHPNVVGVYDVGEDDEGLYLLMDYVEGVPLNTLISQARRVGEPIPVQAAVHVLKQTVEGLHAAHELRELDGKPLELVHRDVSPSNILVDLHGVVRVADFGIARAVGRRTKTSTGLLKGKVGYMAPELLRFMKPDRRADLYSVGVVLYEILSGKRLYPGDEVSEVARRILDEPAPDLGGERNDVPDGLVELGFELLAKEPSLRPATARDVAQRLDEVMQELLLMEEPLDFEGWVRERIDERQIVARREKAEAIRGAILRGEPLPDSEAGTETTVIPRASSGSGRGLWLAVAAVLLVGLGSALGFALSRTDGIGEEEAVGAPTAASPPEGVEDEGPDGDPVDAVPPTPAPASEEDEEEAEADPPATAMAATEMRRRRRSRRTMQSQMMGAMVEMAGATMDDDSLEPWGWE
jgi:serine/threonine-protein kinase